MSYFDYINGEMSECQESEDEEEGEWIEIKPKIRCNILKCKDCHPNNPGFTKEALDNYRKRNKGKKPYTGDKYCSNSNCSRCKNIIKKHNLWREQYFIDNPDEYKKYIAKYEKRQNSSNNKEAPKKEIFEENKNDQTEEIESNSATFNIDNYKITSVIHDGNCGYRAILEVMGINQDRYLDLKNCIAESMEKDNLSEDEKSIIEKEGRTKEEFIEENFKTNYAYLEGEALYFISKYLKSNFKIYLPEERYKNKNIIEINYYENKNIKTLYLQLITGQQLNEEHNNKGKYEGLISRSTGIIENPILFKALGIKVANDGKEKQRLETKIKVLCWNIRSIKDYAKKVLLSTIIIENDIDIAFIQETFLKDKWGIKGYSIKRVNSKHRKGIAIILSENLKCKKQVIEVDNDNGRYIKVKLQDNISKEEIILSSIYLEPKGSIITLGSALESEIIMGDFNDSKEVYGLTKIDKIYQYRGNIKNIEKIPIKNMQISDHPYILGEINIPIKKENLNIKINIIDKNIASNNQNILVNLLHNKNRDGDIIMEEIMENPNKYYEQKNKNISFEYSELIENYNDLKKEWKERYLLKREKEFNKLNTIITSNTNTEEAYMKINSILNYNSKTKFYCPNDEVEKNNIIEGFKEIYMHNENKTNLGGEKIINKILETINALNKYILEGNYEAPYIPKSKALDYFGFSHREIIKLVKGKDLKETIEKLKKITNINT